ncbi:hypothetical protein KM043_013882 [Ampulex compressa]|nr:hypothetical protein KM043_013882 [Ampulex compressa]
MESVEEEDDGNVLRRKDVLAALQGRIPVPGTEMQSLPASVKRRIKALKRLQFATTCIEAQFYEEVHALECAYYKMCAPLYEKRSEIVSGTYEPTDEQCAWESDEEEDGLAGDVKTKLNLEENNGKKEESENVDIKGIPEFWLTIFKNVGTLADMVQEHDESILKHLHDIKVTFLESNPMGFVLEFHFLPNEYFTNSVLTKEYTMKCTPEKNDPFSFEGPEIYKCKGCTIDWKKGKNVTVKTIKKNQKHKSRGSIRTVTKTVQNDSFFNFFSPPIVQDDEAELDDETQALLTSDFEIGHYIKERIVPRAVLYYTGEGLEEEDEEYEEEDGDDDEDDDEDDVDDVDDEEEEEEGGKKKKQVNDPSECKQQ